MTSFQNKIDFAIIFRVNHANPNGDPLNGNRPRTDYEGLGEVTDVCLKRKLRDRLQEAGQRIFVQSDDRKAKGDDYKSLGERAKGILGDKLGGPETTERACAEWFDVRAFGQLFAIKAGKKAKKGEANDEAAGDTGISIGIRGPVSIQSAFSLLPVSVTSTQITKSVSGEGDGSKRGSDTMGMKHRVDHGVYASYGSINPQLAERTGFSDADADVIKAILPKLFENDASSARPDGSMEVLNIVWWKHNCKAGQYSAAKVHDSLRILLDTDGSFDQVALRKALDGLEPDVIPGF
jgi:CRISPR-associated protein Csd2